MTIRAMTKQEVIRILSHHEAALRETFGVKSLALFASVVREAAATGSDVDLLVEFDRPVSLFDLARLEDYLSAALGGSRIDLVLRGSEIEDLKDIIFNEAIDVLH